MYMNVYLNPGVQMYRVFTVTSSCIYLSLVTYIYILVYISR